jgi:hypothetical protein
VKASELSFKLPWKLSERLIKRAWGACWSQISSNLWLDDVELDGEVIQGTAESWRDRLRDTL